MKIIDARWEAEGNQLRILCECGYEFWWPVYFVVCECISCLKQEALYGGPGIDDLPLVEYCL